MAGKHSTLSRVRHKCVAERLLGVEYRDIPGFPGYQVGSDGTVWSQWKLGPWRKRIPEWRKLHYSLSDGYCSYKLYNAMQKSKMIKVHRVVLEVFVGPCPIGQESRHRDDNRANPALDNLCYGTRSQNQLDRKGKGYLHGSKHHQAKLTESQVKRIRRSKCVSISSLADRFGVCGNTIRRILRRELWKHIP